MIALRFGRFNITDGLPTNSTALGVQIAAAVNFSDIVKTETVCSAALVVNADILPHTAIGLEMAGAVALRFSSSLVNSPYSAPQIVFTAVAQVAAPRVAESDCLELSWPPPAHVVAAFDVQISTTLVNQMFSVPANQTSICLSQGQSTQAADNSAASADNSALVISVLGSRLKARYRAVSPAGVSAWSDWTAPWVPKEVPVSSPTSFPIAAIAGAVVGALVAVLVVGLIAFKKLKKSQPTFVDRALIELKQFTTVVKPRTLKSNHVKTGDAIGEGKFGLVCKGTWRTPGMRNEVLVAIKSLHDGFPEEATRAFATEACVMVRFVFLIFIL